MTLTASSNRFGWLLFAVAILLAPGSRAVWMIMVGPFWWYAYQGDGVIGRSADRVVDLSFVLALVVGIASPFVTPIRLRRKLVFSGLAAIGVFVAFYLSAFLVLFIYGV